MVTATYAPHPANAGITPALLWTARTLLAITAPALLLAIAVPWLARNHDSANAIAYTLLGIVLAEIAWVIALRHLRERIRFHVPGAMRKGFAPPRALDLIADIIEGGIIVAAIWIASTATLSMDEIATFIVALTLTFIGAVLIPSSVRTIYRIRRDHPTERLSRVTSMLLRGGIPASIALTIGWGLFPDRLASDGRALTLTMLATTTALLIVLAFLRHATTPPTGNDGDVGARPKRAIGITHTSDSRDTLRAAGDTLGDAVLSWTNAAPSLEDRERARGRGRIGVIGFLALAVLALLLSMLL